MCILTKFHGKDQPGGVRNIPETLFIFGLILAFAGLRAYQFT